MPAPRRQAALGRARRKSSVAWKEMVLRGRPEHHDASSHFSEIAVHKPLLHRRELAPVHALGALIVPSRQEALRHCVRQRHVARWVQIGVGPDRLALVRQQEIKRLFGLLLVKRVLYQSLDVGERHAALTWMTNSKFPFSVYFPRLAFKF